MVFGFTNIPAMQKQVVVDGNCAGINAFDKQFAWLNEADDGTPYVFILTIGMTGAKRYIVTSLQSGAYSFKDVLHNNGELIVVGSTTDVGATSLGATQFGFVMAMASEGCLEYWAWDASALGFTAFSLSSDYESDELFSFPEQQNLRMTVNEGIQFDLASTYGSRIDYQDDFCDVTSIIPPYLTDTVTVSYGDRISYIVEAYEYSLEQCAFGEVEWSLALNNGNTEWSTEVDFD